jgi:hypothetical protein
MSKFKDRLWQQLVREYGHELEQMTRPPGKRARRMSPKLLAGTSFGFAGAGTVAALVLSAASSTPAFAVSRDRDGAVTVTISTIDGIRGANARLAELQVPARAVEVARGCGAQLPPGAMLHALGTVYRGGTTPGPHTAPLTLVRARFYPREIPRGHTLLLPTWRVGGKLTIVRGAAVVGPPPPCFPFPPPPGFPGPGHVRGMGCPPLPPLPWREERRQQTAPAR